MLVSHSTYRKAEMFCPSSHTAVALPIQSGPLTIRIHGLHKEQPVQGNPFRTSPVSQSYSYSPFPIPSFPINVPTLKNKKKEHQSSNGDVRTHRAIFLDSIK